MRNPNLALSRNRLFGAPQDQPTNAHDGSNDRLAAAASVIVVRSLSTALLGNVNNWLQINIQLGVLFVIQRVAPQTMRRGAMIGAGSVLMGSLAKKFSK